MKSEPQSGHQRRGPMSAPTREEFVAAYVAVQCASGHKCPDAERAGRVYDTLAGTHAGLLRGLVEWAGTVGGAPNPERQGA